MMKTDSDNTSTSPFKVPFNAPSKHGSESLVDSVQVTSAHSLKGENHKDLKALADQATPLLTPEDHPTFVTQFGSFLQRLGIASILCTAPVDPITGIIDRKVKGHEAYRPLKKPTPPAQSIPGGTQLTYQEQVDRNNQFVFRAFHPEVIHNEVLLISVFCFFNSMIQ